MKRFFDKVEKTDYCWNFNGASRGHGYGCMKIKGKTIDAHRISWIIHFGEIPRNLLICHKCDNTKCVNPDHLFIGTQKDNIMDAQNKGRLLQPIGQRFVKNHYPDNTHIPLQKAMLIKNIILNRENKTLKSISIENGVPYQYVRDISSGRILRDR